MKVVYSVFVCIYLVFLNHFLSEIQDSAIFCKNLPKTARFWFFSAETEILLWKSYILRLFIYIWCFTIISFLRCKIQPFLQKLAKNSQILIFFSWNWNFTVKVIYSVFNCICLVFLNHFLSEIRDSAISAKISQKQPDFDFFLLKLKFYYESHIFCVDLCTFGPSQSFPFWDTWFSHFLQKLA